MEVNQVDHNKMCLQEFHGKKASIGVNSTYTMSNHICGAKLFYLPMKEHRHMVEVYLPIFIRHNDVYLQKTVCHMKIYKRYTFKDKFNAHIPENRLACLSGHICSPPGSSSYSALSTNSVRIGV